MAFPVTAPSIPFEAYLNGAWRTIPWRQEQDIAIKGGRENLAGAADSHDCSAQIDNLSGDWDPQNPTGSYFGHLGEGVPLRILWDAEITDTFTRTVVDGWGSTTPTGYLWTLSGTAANFDVNGSAGTMVVPSSGQKRLAYLAALTMLTDYEVIADLTITTPASGHNIAGIALRGVSTSEYVAVDVNVTSAGVVRIAIRDTDDNTYLVAPTTVDGVAASGTYRLHAMVEGQTIRGKVYIPGADEPYGWQAIAHSDGVALRGWPGPRVQSGSGTSNVLFTVDNMSIRIPEFRGDITKLEPSWDITGNESTVQLRGHGLLSRLQQGESPLRSALNRALLGGAASDLVAYWPCEDERGATSLAGGYEGVPPMQLTGSPSIAGYSDFDCSKPVAVTSTDSRWAGVVPPYTATGEIMLRWLMHIPAGTANPTSVMTIHITGSAHTWYIYYNGSGQLFIKAYAADGSTLYTGGGIGYNLDDSPAWMTFRLTQDGSDIDFDLTSLKLRDGAAGFASDTLVGHTVGAAEMVVVNRDFNCGGVAFGHITVQANTNSIGELNQPALAYRGERSGRRAERLCGEGDVGFTYIGDLDQTAQMGPQGVDTLTGHLQKCAEVDQATIHDAVGDEALVFRCHHTMVNQDAALALSYSDNHLSGVFRPTTDRFGLMNDVTITRDGGSPRRAEVTTGRKSVLPPPTGIGRIDQGFNRNVYTDDQAEQLAWWMANLGTFDGDRFPQVEIQLERAPFTTATGHDALRLSALGVRVDDRITVDGASSIKRFNQISLLARGWEKRLNRYTHKVTYNCAPAIPYQVFQVEDPTYGRLDTAGSVLAADIDENDTALSIATTIAPLWTTRAAALPFPITIGGELMSVTDIDNELFTFVGVGTPAHGDNASLNPGLPAGWQPGDLLGCVAAIRSTTAFPDGVGGYEWLVDQEQNVRLAWKEAQPGEGAPNVVFSGGSAGDTTSAVIFALRGKVHDLTTKVALVGWAGAPNASAQNVAYPGLHIDQANCVVLYVAWKQDDYTSATTPGTEMVEASTTTGNDQSLTLAYQIQTTAANIAPGSFIITGGASAISRGIVAAIRCDRQAFTVVRNQNGLPGGKSHDAGAPVRLATRIGWAYGGRRS